MGIFAQLNATLFGRGTWPIPSMAHRWGEIELYAALRTSNDERIRLEASVPWNHPYLITPVPRMISRASANMLYGEPPEFVPGAEADRERLDFLTRENDLPSELVRGALISSSEGEVYGRILVQPALLDAPIIEFVSGARVIPHFSGRFMIGATFVSEWQEGRNDFFRLFETYEAGLISSVLYRGTRTSVGAPYPLDGYPRTEGVQENVVTGFDRPLCVFIPNSIDADPTRGFADYRGLEDRFLALNEAETIGQANMRLAGRKRALIDGAYLKEGKMSGDDILIRKSRDAVMGESAKPLEMLEYSFEAAATISWIDHLLDTSLLLTGIAPTMVGRGDIGGAVSGTALRLKAAHSLIEASGKGRHFDRGAESLLQYAAVLDSRRTTEGGFGRSWSDVSGRPHVERQDPLPADENEAAQRLVLLTNADAISTDEKVRALHPGWGEDKVNEEVAKIEGDAPSAPPGSGNPLQPPTPPLNLPTE